MNKSFIVGIFLSSLFSHATIWYQNTGFEIVPGAKEAVTDLMKAAIGGNVQAIDNILRSDRTNASLNMRSNLGMTALAYAIVSHKTDAALELIKKGAEVETRNLWGKTPLAMAKERDMFTVIDAIEAVITSRLAQDETLKNAIQAASIAFKKSENKPQTGPLEIGDSWAEQKVEQVLAQPRNATLDSLGALAYWARAHAD